MHVWQERIHLEQYQTAVSSVNQTRGIIQNQTAVFKVMQTKQRLAKQNQTAVSNAEPSRDK